MEFFFHKKKHELKLASIRADLVEREWLPVDTTPSVVAFTTIRALEDHYKVSTGAKFVSEGDGGFYFPK